MESLLKLAGTWSGEGNGEYPTIASFSYQETTVFTHDGERNQLHFDQRTIRPDAEGNWMQAHWECGFLFWQGDNAMQLCTVHSGGRFEKLDGLLRLETDGWRIDFESDFFGNDARMVASSRVWKLQNGIFSYEMSMATHTTPQPKMLFHLGASLQQSVE